MQQIKKSLDERRRETSATLTEVRQNYQAYLDTGNAKESIVKLYDAHIKALERKLERLNEQ